MGESVRARCCVHARFGWTCTLRRAEGTTIARADCGSACAVQALQHEFQGDVGGPGGLQRLMQGPRAAQSAVVLQRLRALGWARVDCAWRDARLGAFAHNHIQVTRGWLNFEARSHASPMLLLATHAWTMSLKAWHWRSLIRAYVTWRQSHHCAGQVSVRPPSKAVLAAGRQRCRCGPAVHAAADCSEAGRVRAAVLIWLVSNPRC